MKKKLPILEKVTVSGVAAEGKAIVKYGEQVVFVPFAVPGDVVDIQLTGRKKTYAEGRVIRFHAYSSQRATPFCEHYGICGGCQWQILPYSEQLRCKQQQVVDQLTRIGKVELPEISPILGSEKTRRYRNKLEFTFSDSRWLTEEEIRSGRQPAEHNALGFHIPGRFDKVLDIRTCRLQDEISDRIRNEVRTFALAQGLTFFNLRNRGGLLRNLIIRTATTGEVMLILVCYEDDESGRTALLNHLADRFPEITSLLHVLNPKANDTITDLEVHVFKGKDFITEQMEDLRFKIGPKSFFQTNSGQAYRLYAAVRDFAGLTGTEHVYDLYTGTGTIANFLARRAGRVTGIEYVPEAIEDAKVNAAFNSIANVHFLAGDMKDLLTADFIETHGRPDVLITDPPRAGMHGDVIQTILLAAPRRIVYVSCNPATQARDLHLLDADYRIVKVQPVDMFPHTHHVENIVLLERKIAPAPVARAIQVPHIAAKEQ
ncbi:MAG: 23S rRNA (uracil(1939)-C(5))-methyltransferase RlmD [Tannerella sp.]|jgi:23S rRNA (uracil1939-C5)-methyltransferase|nr:23S rRNA (uracil(1939)-C(5))-methyltransferase RlmD [Tannerella sp.]